MTQNRTWKSRGTIDLPDGVTGEIFEANRLRAIVSRDGPDGYWHLSVSKWNGMYPNWDEIADARYDLLPHDIDVGLVLPPPKDYINHHPGVLQLTEIRDPAMPIDRDTYMRRTRETLLSTPGREGG